MPLPTLEELKQRKVVQWGLAYAAAGWVALQAADVLGGMYGLPIGLMRALPVLLAVGLLVVLVLAWYHGERGANRVTGTELAMLTVLLVIAGGVLMILGRGEAVAQAGPSPALVADPEADAVERASIAVLPFENMSGDPEQEYFSDGLTEELLNALARVEGLRVAARTSAFSFKGADVAADSIGRALRVAHLVEGSVRQAGERLRISVRLVDARTGFREWGETYDRDMTDVFAVQDEIGRAIADELRVRVGAPALADIGTSDPEAYGLVLRGREELRSHGDDWLGRATAAFEAAIRRDSTYAAAWGGLARAQRAVVLRDGSLDWAAVDRAIGRALQIDPDEPTALREKGILLEMRDNDFSAALAILRRAAAVSPSDAGIQSILAWSLLRMGEVDEALRIANRAAVLDPISADVLSNVGSVYSYVQEYSRAIQYYTEALRIRPDDAVAIGNLALTYAEMGRGADGVRWLERARAVYPEDHTNDEIAPFILVRAGRREEAARAAAGLPPEAHYARAMYAMALGDEGAALEHLEEAAEDRNYVQDLGMDPIFLSIRDHPRMTRMLAQIGVPALRLER